MACLEYIETIASFLSIHSKTDRSRTLIYVGTQVSKLMIE